MASAGDAREPAARPIQWNLTISAMPTRGSMRPAPAMPRSAGMRSRPETQPKTQRRGMASQRKEREGKERKRKEMKGKYYESVRACVSANTRHRCRIRVPVVQPKYGTLDETNAPAYTYQPGP